MPSWSIKARISRTWDGRPAREDEIATLDASCSDHRLLVEIEAPFHNDPPPPQPAGPMPGLWEYEVVELFLVGPSERYLELEFGPHGHHWILQLNGVRRAVREGLPCDLRVEREGPNWRGAAQLSLEDLPGPVQRWNAFAIHGRAESRRYLAAHPTGGPRPDFHRLGEFPKLRSD